MNDSIITINHPVEDGFGITDIEENDHDIVVWAKYEPPKDIPFCDECGVENPHVHGNGHVPWEVWDTPARGKRVKIILENQRVRCVETGEDGEKCNRTYTLTRSDIHSDYQMTEKCYQHIAEKSLYRRFTRISNDVGPSDTTIGKICREYIDYLDENVLTATPRYLGIDEVKPASRESAYCMITNVQENTVIELLPSRKKEDVSEYIKKMPDREVTQAVVMDMSRGFRSLANQYFPNADVVIDKYHILQYAKQAFEKVRKSVSKEYGKSTDWKTTRYDYLERKEDIGDWGEMPPDEPSFDEGVASDPRFKRSWWLYQRIHDIFDADIDRREAEWAIADWRKHITSELEAPWYDFTGKFNRWHEEIFGYFEHDITNAFTENRNQIAKTFQREGRGYSFEVLRGKVIYGREQLRKPKFGEDIFYEIEPKHLTWGAKIESLASGLHK